MFRPFNVGSNKTQSVPLNGGTPSFDFTLRVVGHDVGESCINGHVLVHLFLKDQM